MQRLFYIEIKLLLPLFLTHVIGLAANQPEGPYQILQQLKLVGNKTTKSHIVLRELPFAIGDTLLQDEVQKKTERARQNLLNTSLFNFVTITSKHIDSIHISITIQMQERWYIFPVPIFEIAERNFNIWWQNKDFARTNYGFYVIKENFRGRKESLSLRARFGYSEQYGFSYQIPYLDKKQKSGMAMSSYYFRGHEMILNTYHNQPVFYKNTTQYIRNEWISKIAYTYRQGLYNTHAINFKHNKAYIADTVKNLNPNFFLNNQQNIAFFSASYFFKHDLRDSRIYPLKGHYIDFEIGKIGLGLLKNERVDVTNVYASLKKYWQLSNRIYLAYGCKGKYSPQTLQPYYIQSILGFRDLVRGYEYYVINGSSYALMKGGLKYELIKPHIKKIPYVNAEKFDTFHYAFYLELFSDCAYVENKMDYQYNNLTNTLVYGTGIGLDFVTYYDNVFRFEYAFNKKGEHGFFIHLYAPI